MVVLWREVYDDSRQILRETWRLAKAVKWWWLLVVVLLAAAVIGLYPHDPALHRMITDDRPDRLVAISNKFRRWGDFRDTVTITLLVWLAGKIARRRAWRTAAIACFLAACLSGITVNMVRFTAGRPRPTVGLQDGFYGPTFHYRMQSFPSGHSGTSTANAVALAMTLPPAGLPALFSAGGVVWACLYSRTHYVTDVLAGATVGITYGLLVGLATRRLLRARQAGAEA